MLKCTRCGRYYVPGYLDCFCRVTSRLPCPPTVPPLPPQEQAALIPPSVVKPAIAAGAAPDTPNVADVRSVDSRA